MVVSTAAALDNVVGARYFAAVAGLVLSLIAFLGAIIIPFVSYNREWMNDSSYFLRRARM